MKEQWKRSETDSKLLVNEEDEHQHRVFIPIITLPEKRRNDCCLKFFTYTSLLLLTTAGAGFIFCYYAQNHEYVEDSPEFDNVIRPRNYDFSKSFITKYPKLVEEHLTDRLVDQPHSSTEANKINIENKIQEIEVSIPNKFDRRDPKLFLHFSQYMPEPIDIDDRIDELEAAKNSETASSETNNDHSGETIGQNLGEPQNVDSDGDAISVEATESSVTDTVDEAAEKSKDDYYINSLKLTRDDLIKLMKELESAFGDTNEFLKEDPNEEDVEVGSEESSVGDKIKNLLELKSRFDNLSESDSREGDSISEFPEGKLLKMLNENSEKADEVEVFGSIDSENSTPENTDKKKTEKLTESPIDSKVDAGSSPIYTTGEELNHEDLAENSDAENNENEKTEKLDAAVDETIESEIDVDSTSKEIDHEESSEKKDTLDKDNEDLDTESSPDNTQMYESKYNPKRHEETDFFYDHLDIFRQEK